MGMEFSIEKFAMLKMKSGKREATEGIKVPNRGSIRTLVEKKNYKTLKENTVKES